MSDSAPAAVMAGAMPSAGASAGAVEGSQKQEGAAAGGTKSATGAMLNEEAAVAIFVAKHTHTTRDSLSCKLAQQYGITSKSVRDIWNLRTWGWATLPHWSPADKRHYLNQRLCNACRRREVATIEAACDRCTVTKRRGRPPGIKETKPRNRTGLSRNGTTPYDDDGGASGPGFSGLNVQMANQMGLPVIFNAPNQIILQQQMAQQMAQRGGNVQGAPMAFAPEMYMQQFQQQQQQQQQQRGGVGGSGGGAGQAGPAQGGASGQFNGNFLLLPHYAVPPGQEGMAFGMDMNGQPMMYPSSYGFPGMVGHLPTAADGGGAVAGSAAPSAAAPTMGQAHDGTMGYPAAGHVVAGVAEDGGASEAPVSPKHDETPT